MKNILKFAFCLFFIVGLVPNLMGCNKLVKQIAKFVKPVAAVEQPVAAVEEPVAAVEEPVAAVEEPVAAVEEPVAAVEEPNNFAKDGKKENFKEVTQDEDLQNKSIEYALNDAKKVTIARSFVKHGKNNKTLDKGLALPTQVSELPALYTSAGNSLSSLPKGTPEYLRTDAYRALFTSLSKSDSDPALVAYLNSTGLGTNDTDFEKPKDISNPLLNNRRITQYYNKWKTDGNINNLIEREMFTAASNENNIGLAERDKFAPKELEGGVFYKMVTDPKTGKIEKVRDENPQIQSYTDIMTKAYNPNNIFKSWRDRKHLFDRHEQFINDKKTEDGIFAFQRKSFDDLKRVIRAGSDLREAYENLDEVVSFDTGDDAPRLKRFSEAFNTDPPDPRFGVGSEQAVITKLLAAIQNRDALNKDQYIVAGHHNGEFPDLEKIRSSLFAITPANRKDADTEIHADNKKGGPAPNF